MGVFLIFLSRISAYRTSDRKVALTSYTRIICRWGARTRDSWLWFSLHFWAQFIAEHYLYDPLFSHLNKWDYTSVPPWDCVKHKLIMFAKCYVSAKIIKAAQHQKGEHSPRFYGSWLHIWSTKCSIHPVALNKSRTLIFYGLVCKMS